MAALPLAIALLFVPALQTPLPAAPTMPPGFERDAPGPDEMAGAAAFGRAMQLPDTAAKLQDLDLAIGKLPRPTRFRGLVQCLRGEALLELDRPNDAEAPISECLRLRPDDAAALWLSTFVALHRKDAVVGTRLMLRAIAVMPERLNQFDPSTMESVLRSLGYAKQPALRSKLLAALAKAGWQASDPGWVAHQARSAIDEALAAGDTAGAARLVPLILSVNEGLMLLTSRRFERIWPQIEEWAGRDLTTQRDARLAAARAAAGPAPSAEAAGTLADALLGAGRAEEAITLLQTLIARPATDWDRADESRFYTIQAAAKLARLLYQVGRGEQGLAVLRRIRAITPIAKFPMAANLTPNLAMLLISNDLREEASALLESDKAAAKEVEAPAALGYFDALKLCAQPDGSDRAAPLAALRRTYSANTHAVVMATSCAGSIGDRRALALQLIENFEQSPNLVLAWERVQRPATMLRTLGQSERLLAGIENDPAIAAAVAKVARPLPERFVPALQNWMPPLAR